MQETAFSTGKHAEPSAPRQLESLHRALDVLERLAQHRGGVALADLARSLGLSKAGAYRILTTMSARGYVDRSVRRTYRLGLRAWELGCGVPELRLVTVAAPFMERLTSATRESSILGILMAFEVVYLHRIDAFQAVRVHTDIGTRIPAHCTSTGLALLSRLTGADLDAILPPALPAFTASTTTDPARLRAEIAGTVRRGYAMTVGTWREDVAGVAAPILGAEGAVLAAVNVSLPRARSTRRRLAELGEGVQATAADIARALRFSDVGRDLARAHPAAHESAGGAAPRPRRRGPPVPGDAAASPPGGAGPPGGIPSRDLARRPR
jgi:DNA-binding IclR family transcriptional regulator